MVIYGLTNIVRQANRPLKEAVQTSLRADAQVALDRLHQGGGTVVEIGAKDDKKANREEALQARLERIAAHYVTLTSDQRQRTVVIDPSREGRAALNQAIRTQLAARGELVGPPIGTEVLTAKGLTRAEAKLALSYEPGDVVRFGRTYRPKGQAAIAKEDYLNVVATDPEAGEVTLARSDGERIMWQPAKWGGARNEAYQRERRELQAGDVISWTRNLPELGALNGRSERVAAVDAKRQVAILMLDDQPVPLDLQAEHSRHWDHGYVRTVHGTQGQTADRVLAHVESHRANLVHQRSFYVAISRAREQAMVVTDSRPKLIEALQERSGAKAAALDHARTIGHAAAQAAAASSMVRPTASASRSAQASVSGRFLER